MVRMSSAAGRAVAVVHDGKEYRLNRKGYVFVPEDAVEVMCSHGFVLDPPSSASSTDGEG